MRNGIGDGVPPSARKGRPCVRIEHGLGRGLDAEPPVEGLVRIADDEKGHIALIFMQFVCGGMEDDDFTNARRTDLLDSGADRTKVQVADRATREATELQMGQSAGGVGDRDGLAGYRGQPQLRKSVADTDASGWSLGLAGHEASFRV